MATGVSVDGTGSELPAGDRIADRRRQPASADACRQQLTTLLKSLRLDRPERHAEALIDEFGSLQEVLSARRGRLLRLVDPCTVEQLKTIRATMLHAAKARAWAGPVISNWPALHNYLSLQMAYDTHESFRVLHVNTKSRLMRDEVMWRGAVDAVQVDVRLIIGRALEIGSTGLILVHNHPSGDPHPSIADREVTRTVAHAGRHLDLKVLDHVIVARDGVVSFRALGLL